MKPFLTGRPETDAPCDYEGLAFVGGHPGLDFLNTVKYRGAKECGDRLIGFSDIARWAHRAGLLDGSERDALLVFGDRTPESRRIHREIRAFREAARVVLDPEFRAHCDFNKAAEIVEREMSHLRPTTRIDRDTGMLVHTFPVAKPRDLKSRIVACIGDLLEHRGDLRIKICEGHDCDWVFVDHSKAGRRKWCDTRSCGNAARVRAHRAAKRQ